jgi:hypothetical protein
VAIAGDVFQLDQEGKAIVIGEIKDLEKIKLAAQACPMRAIFIYDDNKNQLFPPPEEFSRPYQEVPQEIMPTSQP